MSTQQEEQDNEASQKDIAECISTLHQIFEEENDGKNCIEELYVSPIAYKCDGYYSISEHEVEDDLDLEKELLTRLLQDDKEPCSIVIVGDSGMGKSTFAQQLTGKLWLLFFSSSKHEFTSWIPIYVPLRQIEKFDKSKSSRVQNGLVELYVEYYESYFKNSSSDCFRRNFGRFKFILILDGFDELEEKCNLWAKNNWANEEKLSIKTVILCKSHIFWNSSISQLENWFQIKTKNEEVIDMQVYAFKPFNDSQIFQFIKKVVNYLQLGDNMCGPWQMTREFALKSNADWVKSVNLYEKWISVLLPELRGVGSTPFLLAIIVQILPQMVEKNVPSEDDAIMGQEVMLKAICKTEVGIYDEFVSAWFTYQATQLIQVDTGHLVGLSADTIKSLLYVYTQNLASFCIQLNNGTLGDGSISRKDTLKWDLWARIWNQDSGIDSTPKWLVYNDETIANLFPTSDSDTDPQKFENLAQLRNASLLTFRNGKKGKGTVRFLHLSLLEYFCGRHVFSELRAVLNYHANHHQDCVSNTAKALPYFAFNQKLITNPEFVEVLYFLVQKARSSTSFQSVLLQTVQKSAEIPGLNTMSANAATVLSKSRFSFSNLDLKYVQIPYANLSNSIFTRCDLRGANLQAANLSHCWMVETKLDGANLSRCEFGEYPPIECDSGEDFEPKLVTLLRPNTLLSLASDYRTLTIYDVANGESLSVASGGVNKGDNNIPLPNVIIVENYKNFKMYEACMFASDEYILIVLLFKMNSIRLSSLQSEWQIIDCAKTNVDEFDVNVRNKVGGPRFYFTSVPFTVTSCNSVKYITSFEMRLGEKVHKYFRVPIICDKKIEPWLSFEIPDLMWKGQADLLSSHDEANLIACVCKLENRHPCIKIYNISDGTMVASLPENQLYFPDCCDLSFSPCGYYLLIKTECIDIDIWRRRDNRIIPVIVGECDLPDVSFPFICDFDPTRKLFATCATGVLIVGVLDSGITLLELCKGWYSLSFTFFTLDAELCLAYCDAFNKKIVVTRVPSKSSSNVHDVGSWTEHFQNYIWLSSRDDLYLAPDGGSCIYFRGPKPYQYTELFWFSLKDNMLLRTVKLSRTVETDPDPKDFLVMWFAHYFIFLIIEAETLNKYHFGVLKLDRKNQEEGQGIVFLDLKELNVQQCDLDNYNVRFWIDQMSGRVFVSKNSTTAIIQCFQVISEFDSRPSFKLTHTLHLETPFPKLLIPCNVNDVIFLHNNQQEQCICVWTITDNKSAVYQVQKCAGKKHFVKPAQNIYLVASLNRLMYYSCLNESVLQEIIIEERENVTKFYQVLQNRAQIIVKMLDNDGHFMYAFYGENKLILDESPSTKLIKGNTRQEFELFHTIHDFHVLQTLHGDEGTEWSVVVWNIPADITYLKFKLGRDGRVIWTITKTLSRCRSLSLKDSSIFNAYYVSRPSSNLFKHFKSVGKPTEFDKYCSFSALFVPVSEGVTSIFNIAGANRMTTDLRRKWCVTVVAKKCTGLLSNVNFGVKNHVSIVIEGIRYGRHFAMKADLTLVEGKVVIKLVPLNSKSRFMKMAVNFRAKQWQVESEVGVRLVKDILQDKTNAWAYNLRKRNCCTWVKRKLEVAGIQCFDDSRKFCGTFVVDMAKDFKLERPQENRRRHSML